MNQNYHHNEQPRVDSRSSSPVSDGDDDDELAIQITIPASSPSVASNSSARLGSNGDNSNKTFKIMALYVGDLDPSVTETMLYQHFGSCGPISSIKLCRDAVTQKSLCYAYVNFASEEGGKTALEDMNFSLIAGKPCRIVKAMKMENISKKGNIYIRNLDPFIDSKKLLETFSMFGPIVSCKVLRNRLGESVGKGYVQFETEQSANEAVIQTNGIIVGRQQVQVDHFMDKNERNNQAASLFVRGIPRDCLESEIQSLFGVYGEIRNIYLPNSNRIGKIGWGYVNFCQEIDAQIACKFMNGFQLGGSELAVCMSRGSAGSGEFTEKGSRHLLFGSLASDMTEATLTELVKKTDAASSLKAVKVYRTSKTTTVGQAMIELTSDRDAARLLHFFQNPMLRFHGSVTLLPVAHNNNGDIGGVRGGARSEELATTTSTSTSATAPHQQRQQQKVTICGEVGEIATSSPTSHASPASANANASTKAAPAATLRKQQYIKKY